MSCVTFETTQATFVADFLKHGIRLELTKEEKVVGSDDPWNLHRLKEEKTATKKRLKGRNHKYDTAYLAACERLDQVTRYCRANLTRTILEVGKRLPKGSGVRVSFVWSDRYPILITWCHPTRFCEPRGSIRLNYKEAWLEPAQEEYGT